MTDSQALALRNKMLGAILRQARTDAGKSIRETAELIGTSRGIYGSYERGKRAISLPELELFAYHLNIPLGHFLSLGDEGADEKQPIDSQLIIGLRQRMIGATLRTQRSEAGLSIKDLAGMVSIPSSRLSSYEQGSRPIPLTELGALANAVDHQLDEYVDSEGPVGEWDTNLKAFRAFEELPHELRQFFSDPANRSYLELAHHLSEISVDRLRAVAEGLLDITL
jgi:transcriptional regulator with XRE-family HTH domain